MSNRSITPMISGESLTHWSNLLEDPRKIELELLHCELGSEEFSQIVTRSVVIIQQRHGSTWVRNVRYGNKLAHVNHCRVTLLSSEEMWNVKESRRCATNIFLWSWESSAAAEMCASWLAVLLEWDLDVFINFVCHSHSQGGRIFSRERRLDSPLFRISSWTQPLFSVLWQWERMFRKQSPSLWMSTI